MPNNRFHKGAQKPGGLINGHFIIKRASKTVRIAFVPCEAERYALEKKDIKMSESEWTKQGGTFSHKNACKEFGLTEKEIFDALKAGKL
ncbi:MAG: hypothetical protein PVG39_30220 [Desulfobacteraceae bacterium]